MNRKRKILLICLFLWGPAGFIIRAGAQPPAAADSPTAGTILRPRPEAAVRPFGNTLFYIATDLGPFTARDRADHLERKIRQISEDPFFHPDSLKLINGETTTDVAYGQTILTTVGESDAGAAGASKDSVALDRKNRIGKAVQDYLAETRYTSLLKKLAVSIGILVLLITLLLAVSRLFRKLRTNAKAWQQRLRQLFRLPENSVFSRERQTALLLFLLRVSQWFLVLLLLTGTMLGIFYLLPWTKALSMSLLGFAIDPLKKMLTAIWEFIPSLITILVILFVARLVLRGCRFLKNEIEDGSLKIPGFYPEWALPTFNILRVLVILFTIVAVWPYLPGSESQIFQGVSVFFGLVFSLTSASALSNFMAGLTITYTRAFKIGDRVRIGEVTGDIIGKSMLVTKIRTVKNEEITIPNTKVMGSEVINYSTCAPGEGLILYTTVTIGYDAPWRQVHALLTGAALATEHILPDPPPFVLQTALNDFYVSYQLNAYTREPNKQSVIMSRLHENIQDAFNRAGVEIMSPHYRSVRDGNTLAIPDENRPEGYEPPVFRVGK